MTNTATLNTFVSVSVKRRERERERERERGEEEEEGGGGIYVTNHSYFRNVIFCCEKNPVEHAH